MILRGVCLVLAASVWLVAGEGSAEQLASLSYPTSGDNCNVKASDMTSTVLSQGLWAGMQFSPRR